MASSASFSTLLFLVLLTLMVKSRNIQERTVGDNEYADDKFGDSDDKDYSDQEQGSGEVDTVAFGDNKYADDIFDDSDDEDYSDQEQGSGEVDTVTPEDIPQYFPPYRWIETTTNSMTEFSKLTASVSSGLQTPILVDRFGGPLGTVLRFEIFAKAAGRNFVLTPATDRNAALYQSSVAHALTNAWLILEYSETTDRFLNGIIRNVVFEFMLSHERLTEEKLRSLFEVVLDQVETWIREQDQRAAPIYDESRKEKLAPYADPRVFILFDALKAGQVSQGRLREWLANENTAQFLIHQQLLNMSKNEYNKKNGNTKDFKAGVILDVSKHPCCGNCSAQQTDMNCGVQEIYIKALTRAAKSFRPDQFVQDTMGSFILDVESSAKANPTLWCRFVSVAENRLLGLPVLSPCPSLYP